MSTASEREAALRRALLSAAEQIEPAPGGLERIQQRLRRPRPALIAGADAAWTVVLMRAPDVIEALRRRASNVLRHVWDRFGPKSAQGSGPPWLRWLRPLVAMSVAAFVVGAGVYIGLASPEGVFPTGGLSSGTQGDNGSPVGGPARGSHGTIDGTATQSVYPGAASSSGSSSSCSPSASPYNLGHAPTGAPIVPTTPTSTSSQTTTPPPSATSSDSSSPNPSDSTSASGGGSAATPDPSVASGNPASAGGTTATGTGASDGTSQSTADSSQRGNRAAQSARSPATTGKSQPPSNSKQYNPCQKKKPKPKKSSQATTSAKLTQTQPGGAVAAKLD